MEKVLSVRIEEEIIKSMKQLALDEETTLKNIVADVLVKGLATKGVVIEVE